MTRVGHPPEAYQRRAADGHGVAAPDEATLCTRHTIYAPRDGFQGSYRADAELGFFEAILLEPRRLWVGRSGRVKHNKGESQCTVERTQKPETQT